MSNHKFLNLELDVNLVDRLVEAEPERRQNQQTLGGDPADSVEEGPVATIKRNALMNDLCR